jgi:hypothetical protein
MNDKSLFVNNMTDYHADKIFKLSHYQIFKLTRIFAATRKSAC